MAFVYMAEKQFSFNCIDLNNNKTTSPGPGQYISQTRHRKIKGNSAPFGIASLRFNTDSNTKNNPGPGDYEDKLLHKGWIKKYYKRHPPHKSHNNQDNTHKSQLITEASSYEHRRPSQSDTTTKPKKKSRVYQINLLSQSNSEQIPIPSIPTKQLGVGYDVTNDGKLVKKTNPDFYRTFTGEKCDSVGPGNYELEFSDKWLRTGTQWSKMKEDRQMTSSNSHHPHSKHKKKYCLETLIHIDGDKHNNQLQNKRNMLLQDIWKQSANLTKYNIRPDYKLKGFNDRDFVDYRLIRERDLPGPGYYEDKLSNSMDNKANKTMKQSFYNVTAKYRAKYAIDINNDKAEGEEDKDDDYIKKHGKNLGPGSYFRPMNKHEEKKLMRIKLKMREDEEYDTATLPFTSTCERFNSNKDNNEQLGPGKYHSENDNDLIHKTFNATKMQFGLKEVRFPKRNEVTYHNKNNPGPGTYINPYSCTGTDNTVNYKGVLIPLNKAKQNTHFTIPRMKHQNHPDTIPPVGFYNPELQQSIEYKNIKKIISSHPSNTTCFNTSKNLLPHDTQSSHLNTEVGPGSYFQSKQSKPYQINPPFNVSQKKFISNFKQIGPAKYDLNLPWNKQSFNVNFIS